MMDCHCIASQILQSLNYIEPDKIKGGKLEKCGAFFKYLTSKNIWTYFANIFQKNIG